MAAGGAPVGPRGVYEAKGFAEAMTTAYDTDRGVDPGIVRIFNTYGRSMWPDDGRAIRTFIRQALTGKPFTRCGEVRRPPSASDFPTPARAASSPGPSCPRPSAEPVRAVLKPAFSAEGMAFAVAAAAASSAAARWRQSPEDVPSETCNDVVYADDTIEVAVASPHEDASTLAQSLLVHGQAINSGAYDVAYAVFTKRMRRRVGPVDTWSAGLATSYWRHLLVVDVAPVSENVSQVDVELTTQQDPEFGRDGQTCSDWRLRYTMVWDGFVWQSDAVEAPHGDPLPC